MAAKIAFEDIVLKVEHEGEDYKVVSHILNPDDPLCVVAFQNWRNPQGVNIKHFAAKFFWENRVNAVFVHVARNDWFLRAEMETVVEKINAVTKNFAQVVTYGSSMGGYAAIRFAGALNASRAVAISPQYSINPIHFPDDKRWLNESKLVSFERESEDFRIPEKTDVYIVADNLRYEPVIDILHVKRYRRHGKVNLVAFPFSGHPSMFYLFDLKMVSALSIALIKGDLARVAALRKRSRAERKGAPTYWANRGCALSRRDPETALECFSTALRLGGAIEKYRELLKQLPTPQREALMQMRG